ncbi:MAG: hypothetical protein UT43_C0020G0002 [Parcubacteria group bacterium GW2011_GWC1_39_29]|nr:MAG: hypothetical protein UT43_C0020G0002 [Parcubacteria group bacterium GW2011_GWC1_39_29]
MKTNRIKQCPEQTVSGIKSDTLSKFMSAIIEAVRKYDRACHGESIRRGIENAKNRKDNKNNEK